jgi:hypothetical protein
VIADDAPQHRPAHGSAEHKAAAQAIEREDLAERHFHWLKHLSKETLLTDPSFPQAAYGLEARGAASPYPKSARSVATLGTSQSINRLRPMRRNPFAVSSLLPLIQ